MRQKQCWVKMVLVFLCSFFLVVGMTACGRHTGESVENEDVTGKTEVEGNEETSEEERYDEEFSTADGSLTADVEAESDREEPTSEEAVEESSTTEELVGGEVSTEQEDAEETTIAVLVAQSISAKVKGNHYIGDTLSAADFTVTVTMSDGTIRKNPAGWTADVLYLNSTETLITISYQGVNTVITVSASERPVETQPAKDDEATGNADQSAPQDPGTSNDGLSLRRDAAEEAFRIQNDIIVQNGGTPLTWSEVFYQQACKRAQDIVTNFSHDGFYDTTAYAENIAMGSYDANVMVQAWYNSEGHRNNMLHGWKYGAIACYGDYWVALFGPTAG